MSNAFSSARSSAASRPFAAHALRLVASAIRSRLNRRKVARLEHMSDWELNDIGLTRLDLNIALEDSRFFEDPSHRLRSSKVPKR